MISPIRILQDRAEARALLFEACEFDLEEAIAPLAAYADASGITEEIGAEAVRDIIHSAFKGVAEL